mmetsp:Transcript_62438/g.70645  ORF Transcript_62438/g.70645 Transcript_62438/m.70645 type:complete len:99 (-) Transcript_62438:115-411(-)
MVGISRSVISSISTTVFISALVVVVVVAIDIRLDRIPLLLPCLLLVFCGEKADTTPPPNIQQQNKHTNTDNDNEITADNWNFILLCYRMVYYDCYTVY